MEAFPLISIISLNYNRTQVTCEFLESLYKLTYPNFEVIVVDNASDENPKEKFQETYPDLNFVRSNKNLGFAGGNNLGIKEAKGSYYFIVNNDTEVTPSLLENLMEPFLKDNKIGIVCPKIKYFDQPDLIQYAGFTAINPFTGRNKTIGGKERDVGQYDRGYSTHYSHGAAMLVKSDVVKEVGLIPEVFFLCYEELDWSEQMKRAGYHVYFEGTATIFHKESMTMGKESPLKVYFHFRNRILFMRRNYKGVQLLVFYLFMICISIPKTFLLYAARRKGKHIKSIVSAISWHLIEQKEFQYIK